MITDNRTDRLMFLHYLSEISRKIHATAREKGWWDTERNDGELIALIHSELSELLEALREGNPPDDKLPGLSSAEVEAADVLIRIFDMAYSQRWRLGDALLAKMAYNETREHRHGGKRF